MGVTGVILKNGVRLKKTFSVQKKQNASISQKKVLTKLLRKAQFTVFGAEYGYSSILKQENKISAFQELVPIHNYETMLKWWTMSLQGEPSVCWPGMVNNFALSSGTSEGSSKYIPITKSMLRAIQKAIIGQMISIAEGGKPKNFLDSDILMLGGSTSLVHNGIYNAGDLSGITAQKLPFWFMPYYKPGKEIAKTKDWQKKLDLITKEAHKWNVGTIVGVPAWLQLLMERLIELNKVKNIHEVWPNLSMCVHGGVHFKPYRASFEALLGKPIIYRETYLASEGFIAFQARPDATGMQLILKNYLFFEFIPFNNENFDLEGNPKPNPQVLTISEVEENTEYALLLSTCAGAWRYLIGDVIRFTNIEHYEVTITGRTKHFLSMVGEHLSVENMNKAIELCSEDLNIQINEFTVAGIPYKGFFAHHWFISNDKGIDKEIVRKKLDESIKMINDDYRVERNHALKEVIVDVVPSKAFIDWLKYNGKEGAQSKFPRVLRNEQYHDWKKFIENYPRQTIKP